MKTRRDIIKKSGGTAAILSVGSFLESEEASHPPHPTISNTILNEYGWSLVDQWQETFDQSLWSFSAYNWEWLQEKVQNETDGKINIPLGGILAFRIGNNGTTYKITDDPIVNGETFATPRVSGWWRRSDIDSEINTYFEDFAGDGMEKLGEFNWGFFRLSSGPVTGTLVDVCEDADGSITLEVGKSRDMVEHNLEYELRSDTVNETNEVDLASEVELDMIGWAVDWTYKGNVYGMAALHPKAAGDYCGITRPHIERVLTAALDEDVNLDIDHPFFGEVLTVMGAVE